MSGTYQNNGQYALETLELEFNSDGQVETVDLSAQLVVLNLYESMEHQVMTGNLSVMDTVDLPNILSLYGDEIIRVSFYTAGNEQNPITFEGRLYKISPKHRITEHAVGYTFYFHSQAASLSDRSFVHRGYQDNNHNIASDLYEYFLQGNSPKQLITTPTKGISSFCFGAIKPLEAISILEKQSVSDQGDHSYVFYENHESFVFKPLQELYRQEPVASYYYGAAGVFEDIDKKHEESFEKIQAINIMDDNSFTDRLLDGLHGSRHVMFDLVTKTLMDGQDVVYDKESWFDPSKSLGNISVKQKIDKKDDCVFISYGSGVQDLLSHKDRIDSRMKRIELETFKCEIEVFGDSRTKVGDVLNCYIPNLNMDQENIKNEFSGNMLITSIHHELIPTRYMQTIMIQKDSYEDLG